ncbi:hypothetical protein [Commensalibacter melissae]|uniref:hypothetical protein n=1 Tax=Commensalibacter melissae TaxID=2070537 RepID=UPI000EFBAB60|nr:hypothetical protein [Commensalibacter melissae]AYN86263.1 hypothetical protein D9V35_01500 [Commensalibacter melissae]
MVMNVDLSYCVAICNRHFYFCIDYFYDDKQSNKDNLTKFLENFSNKELYLGLCEEFPEEKEELKEIQDDRDALIDFIMNKIDKKMSDI